MTTSVKGTEKKVVNLDFSTAKSFSDVATELASAVGAVSGAFNSDQNVPSFLTTTETGDTASISFATKRDLQEQTCPHFSAWTEDSGAVLSQGSDALTPAQNMNLWLLLLLVTGSDSQPCMQQRLLRLPLLAAWADIDDDYVYFDWSTDTKMLDQFHPAHNESRPVS
ncbi:MAG: hypothetical protein ACLSE8_15675 [Parasutterella sp.]